MVNRICYDGGIQFKRISKQTARRVYNNGCTVVCCPVNLRPFSRWNPQIEFTKGTLCTDGCTFDQIVSGFEYSNCIDNETGKYTAFYIPVRTVDRFTGEPPTADTLETITVYDHRYMEV